MRRCLELASRGFGATGTNPMVGALLVHNNEIIGEGFHEQFGGPHAEVNCFNNVPDSLKHLIPESTMYVTLEPCSHYGKTPPCALRILKERVKKVVICNNDPNPLVNGKGTALLREQGIDVKTEVLANEGRILNKRFFCLIEQQRPYVILKWAQSADGFFAPTDKSRMQLSNQLSQHLLHKWRSEESAFMVGTTTALNDSPRLNNRLWSGNSPKRVVIDRDLKIPSSHHLYDGSAPTIIFTEKIRHPQHIENVTFINLPFDERLPENILDHLKHIGIASVVIEGGAYTINKFIEANLWDQARIFQTGTFMHKGVCAPLLKNYIPDTRTSLGSDTLFVYLKH